jgi:hypothetical protein
VQPLCNKEETARDTRVCTARASCLPPAISAKEADVTCLNAKLARSSASPWERLSASWKTAVTSDAGIGATASTDAKRRKSCPCAPQPA